MRDNGQFYMGVLTGALGATLVAVAIAAVPPGGIDTEARAAFQATCLRAELDEGRDLEEADRICLEEGLARDWAADE